MESINKCIIATFIALACVREVVACPYDHPNCFCTDGGVTCTNLQQMPPLRTGAGVARVSYLSFQGGNVTRISSNSLPPDLQTIALSHLPLTDIADDALDNSSTSLHKLSITGAQLRKLPNTLVKLQTLRELHIIDIPIQEWDISTLQQLGKSVKFLELRNVSLSAWPSWLAYFGSLISLTLDANSLTNIPDDALTSFKNTLQQLSLGDTKLTQIPEVLSALRDLDTLNISSNSFPVSDLERLVMMPCAHTLVYLYMDSIGITTLANLSSMTNLTMLRLSNNRISDIPAESMPPYLSILILSGNNLSTVPADIAYLTELTFLDLGHNRLTEIAPDSFSSRLEQLYLSFNNLTLINDTDFGKLTLLRSLDLNYNSISVISPLAFSDLQSLTFLSILGSRLKEVPLAFALLSSVRSIEVSTGEAFSCPCPARRQLVEWFTSQPIKTLPCINCTTGQPLCRYLDGQCGIPRPTVKKEQDSTMPPVAPRTSLSPGSSTPSSSLSIHSSPTCFYYYLTSTIIFLYQVVASPH